MFTKVVDEILLSRKHDFELFLDPKLNHLTILQVCNVKGVRTGLLLGDNPAPEQKSKAR